MVLHATKENIIRARNATCKSFTLKQWNINIDDSEEFLPLRPIFVHVILVFIMLGLRNGNVESSFIDTLVRGKIGIDNLMQAH